MTADKTTPRERPTPERQAETVAQHMRETHGARSALNEMQQDLKGMNTSERTRFFDSLAGEAAKTQGGLPNLEITGTHAHNDLKVSVKGQHDPVYDEHGGFSGGLRKGEGPYQALHRQHPEWDHKQLMDEAHRIKKELGPHSFKQGEEFKTNEDGSVSVRSKTHDGGFEQQTRKDGKVTETQKGDSKGNYDAQQYDSKGNKGDTIEHRVTNDGYTETQKDQTGNVTRKVTSDKDGTLTETYDKDKHATSSMREKPDGSVKGWRQNADGSRTEIDQPDKDHRTETTIKGGEKTTSTWERTADGEKRTTTDAKGTNTDIYDKAGNQISADRKNNDGSSIGWHKNADGTVTSYESADPKHRTETTLKDGQPVSTKTIEQTSTGRNETIEDNAGNKWNNSYDTKGNQIAGSKTNPDGSQTGWSKDSHGNITHFDVAVGGAETSMKFDPQGKLIQREWHDDKTGIKGTETQVGDYIHTQGVHHGGLFGWLVNYESTVKGKLQPPDA
ncbi:MAG TPA: hypothetical protein V6C76_05720 [Drouetiella sp.]